MLIDVCICVLPVPRRYIAQRTTWWRHVQTEFRKSSNYHHILQPIWRLSDPIQKGRKTLPRKADASSFVVVHWLVGWVSFEVSKGGDGKDVDFSPSGIFLLFLRERMTRFILLAVWFEPMSKHTWTQDSRKRFQSFNTSGRLWWQIPFRPLMASIIIRLTCALLFPFLCKKWRLFLGRFLMAYRYPLRSLGIDFDFQFSWPRESQISAYHHP